MDRRISQQVAINAVKELTKWYYETFHETRPTADAVIDKLMILPSAQHERTEHIPDTKAVRSKRDCVDLSEHVSATFYDQEHEEWTQQTVTIADVLDSVCDEYTILPSAQPEIIRCKDCKWWSNNDYRECSSPNYDDGYVTPAGFYCGYAERRTDEQVN